MSGQSLPLDPSIRDAATCGCCEGVDVQTPLEIWNRAGLPAVGYRIGTHGSFKASMLARLSSADFPALHQLTTRDDGDPTIALIDAAAVMADVLTFYQERIANESYLRTATEWRSLAALGRLTGYEPSPGVAATACLAFTLETAAGAPEETLIPQGTRIQSIPAAGQMPQTFETLAPFTARPEWTAMTVMRTMQQPTPNQSTKSVLVQGLAPQVRVGDWLLLAAGTTVFPKQVYAVTQDAKALTTQIDFAPDSPMPQGLPIAIPSPQTASTTTPTALTTDALEQQIFAQAWDGGDLLAFVRSMKWSLATVMAGVIAEAATSAFSCGGAIRFRQKASVFGYNAPAWNALPASQTSSTPPVGTISGGAAGAPGSGTVTNATVANVTISNATVTNAAIAGPAGVALQAQPIFGGIVVGTIVPGSTTAPYWANWDEPRLTRLDIVWTNNTPIMAGDGRGNGNSVVQLDHVYTGIGPGSWILMRDASSGGQIATTVRSVSDIGAVGFSLSAKVTQVDLGPATDLSNMTRRGTTILCDNEWLALASIPMNTPVEGVTIVLDRIYLGLQAGQSIAVSGTRTDLNGVAGTELAVLAAVTIWGNLTVLTLAAPLAHSYVPQSVLINANVVIATHGMSVSETLGSGDASTPFQSFVLRQPPLTFVADPSGGGARNTLNVRVNGELWSEAATLYGAAPTDKVFVTWRGDDGRTGIMFGDSITGARLPTGSGNVTATYRTGIGAAGLVGANAVSLLMTRPLGVRSVSNPVATTDGADPDSPDMLRQTAPLHVLTLDRVVSLDDYRNFARAYPGIAKAFASWQWNARGRTVRLTVAGQNGAVVDPAGPLGRSLLAAIAARSDPNVPVVLGDYQPVFFQIAADVKTDPALVRDSVLAAVQTALQDAFAFASRDFGQNVQASEVIATMQSVPGVIACEPTLLTRPPLQGGVASELIAATPPPGVIDPPPAEILLVDPRPIVFGSLP